MTPRLAAAPDTVSLAELHKAVFEESAWDENFWKGAIASAFDQVLLLGSPPRAFAAWRHLGEEAEILTIGTTRPRGGDGRALLAALMASATAAGARRLFLEVSEANKAAIRLYRSSGFEPTGLRRGYYRDGSDAFVLCADLTKGE